MPTKSTTKKSTVKAVKSPKKEAGNPSDFAVITTGGKQYVVREGKALRIEKLKGDYKAGDKVSFDNVLLVNTGADTKIGTPYLADSKVEATIKEIARATKITVIKYKQKSRYFKKNGHSQPYFEVVIDKIK